VIDCVGGGGGGGNQAYGWVAGGGGGGGAYASGVKRLFAGNIVSVSVGYGGLEGPYNAWQDGDNGGASFVSVSGIELVRADGGKGGQGSSGRLGGAGGTGTTHGSVESPLVFAGGRGGNAWVVNPGVNSGGGGGSAGNTNGPGYNGSSGLYPLGASAQSGEMSLGAGGWGYYFSGGDVLPSRGGTGGGGGGGDMLYIYIYMHICICVDV
jgi:hypothetical protein